MVKRFSKKQGSKQGVILLTVVFILAMAIIFISACMVMTQATRNRLYWKAEQSQARLTVTSAAEAFYQALLVGDFKESDLKTLAAANATGIKVTAKDKDGKYLPGMSLADNNCTLLSLKRKDDKYSEIYAYLTTTINGETERVKITFKVVDKAKTYGLFQNPVDYNGTTGNLNFDSLGRVMTAGADNGDNFVVIRHGTKTTDTGANVYSNVIFTDGYVTDFVGNYYNDIVFLNNAQIQVNNDKSYSWGNPNVYFVNNGGTEKPECISGSSMVTMSIGTGNLIIANRTLSSFTGGANAKLNDSNIIALDVTSDAVTTTTVAAGTINHPGTLTTEISQNAQLYTSSDFNNKQIGEFPTASESFAKIKMSDGSSLPQTAPSAYTKMSVSEVYTNYGISYDSTEAKSGAGFTFLGQKSDGTIDTNLNINSAGCFGPGTDKTKPTIYLLDGNQDYIIYLSDSSGKYDFRNSIFAVVNPSNDHTQVIVLQTGVKIQISYQQAETYCGILSIERPGISDSAENYFKYLTGKMEGKPTGLASEMTVAAAGEYKFSSYYDSLKKPAVMILGAGNNQLNMMAKSVFEGYAGLYNPKPATPGGTTTKSYVGIRNLPQIIYGRLIFDDLVFVTEDGSIESYTNTDSCVVLMPYCPGPDDGGTLPDIEPYKFGYTVVSVDYYYTDEI